MMKLFLALCFWSLSAQAHQQVIRVGSEKSELGPFKADMESGPQQQQQLPAAPVAAVAPPVQALPVPSGLALPPVLGRAASPTKGSTLLPPAETSQVGAQIAPLGQIDPLKAIRHHRRDFFTVTVPPPSPPQPEPVVELELGANATRLTWIYVGEGSSLKRIEGVQFDPSHPRIVKLPAQPAGQYKIQVLYSLSGSVQEVSFGAPDAALLVEGNHQRVINLSTGALK